MPKLFPSSALLRHRCQQSAIVSFHLRAPSVAIFLRLRLQFSHAGGRIADMVGPLRVPFPPAGLAILSLRRTSLAIAILFAIFRVKKHRIPHCGFGWRRACLRQKNAAICKCDFWCTQVFTAAIAGCLVQQGQPHLIAQTRVQGCLPASLEVRRMTAWVDSVSHYSAIGDTISAHKSAIGFRGKFFLDAHPPRPVLGLR